MRNPAGLKIHRSVSRRSGVETGQRPLMAAGMLLQACGLGWFPLTATTGASYQTLVLPLAMAGVGISMALPTTPAAALGAVAPGDLGKASGANSTLQRFGAVFGVTIATAVFSATGRIGSPASFDAGFRPALAVVAGISLLGFASALAVARRRRTDPDAATLRVSPAPAGS